VALSAVAALALSACGDNAPPANNGGGSGANVGNAAVNKTANASTQKGGTLRLVQQDDWDSLDPADTYYGFSWNFIRLYARQLVMFKAAAGGEGATLVPDLATDLGTASADNKTWTYHIRKGVKYEDGTEIKAQDVKYDVERTLDKDTFPNGPTYFNDFLDTQGYVSPYKGDNTPGHLGLKAIDTPDDYTIVFHLKKPYAAFDYFAAIPSTAPVPQSKDTGPKYKDHVISSGPYMFDQMQPGKSFTMKRNPNYDPATAPTRPPALPDRIEVQLKVTNSNDIDQRLMSGSADLDVAGSGVQPAAQAQILRDPDLRSQSDSVATTRLWYSVINSDVKPLDNIHCRKAIEWAVDKTNLQRAYGGSVGGDIATNMMPPVIPGAQQFDLYATPDHKGDINKAKDELKQCGHPDGFTFNISYRAGRDKEQATAEALSQSLSKIGIKTELQNFPTGDYLKLYAGKPAYAKSHNLGIMVYGWQADWPDGFGFMAQITDSRTIHQSGGNSNLGVKDPDIDKMIDSTLNEKDATKRNQIWVNVDKKVMEDAYTIPGVWAKPLLFRPKNLTNVFVTDGFSQYDYLALGTSNK
jgi:peptide/nickel transport system substrate-binding protein